MTKKKKYKVKTSNKLLANSYSPTFLTYVST